MEKKIKLIWDFRGEDSLEMAKHHCIHLREFAEIDNLDYHEINHKIYNEMYAIAFITVSENQISVYRDALRPHRGEIIH